MKLSLLLLSTTVATTSAFAPVFVPKTAMKLYAEESASSSFVPLETAEGEAVEDESLDAVEKLGRGAAKVSADLVTFFGLEICGCVSSEIFGSCNDGI